MARLAEPKDFEVLGHLYTEFFPTHNIFSKRSEDILAYLNAIVEPILIVEDAGVITAAAVVVTVDASRDETHKRAKFRHFAYTDDKSASELLEACESHIIQTGETVKIEQAVAEGEKGFNMYLANGYEKEGELTNHYRFGEKCFILGKTLQN